MWTLHRVLAKKKDPVTHVRWRSLIEERERLGWVTDSALGCGQRTHDPPTDGTDGRTSLVGHWWDTWWCVLLQWFCSIAVCVCLISRWCFHHHMGASSHACRACPWYYANHRRPPHLRMLDQVVFLDAAWSESVAGVSGSSSSNNGGDASGARDRPWDAIWRELTLQLMSSVDKVHGWAILEWVSREKEGRRGETIVNESGGERDCEGGRDEGRESLVTEGDREIVRVLGGREVPPTNSATASLGVGSALEPSPHTLASHSRMTCIVCKMNALGWQLARRQPVLYQFLVAEYPAVRQQVLGELACALHRRLLMSLLPLRLLLPLLRLLLPCCCCCRRCFANPLLLSSNCNLQCSCRAPSAAIHAVPAAPIDGRSRKQ